MRKVIFKGLNDKLFGDLSYDVDVICHVMSIGKALDQITFEAEILGSELINIIKKFKLDKSLIKQINPENKYILTAYDW